MRFFLFGFILYGFIAEATILPPNDLLLYDTGKSEGLSLQSYHETISRFEAIYKPIIEKTGHRLIINRLWENPLVNAGTLKNGKDIVINLYGGYARHPFATPDGYALVICHELGHHFGGFPKKKFQDGKIGWPSTEGQADYFATLKCLRNIFKDEEFNVPEETIPKEVLSKCRESFTNLKERLMCIRSSLAGMTVAKISTDIRRYEFPPAFETPDTSIVPQTFEPHPLPQCRLDTYFQGSLCHISHRIPFSAEDETKGSCHRKTGYQTGMRPLCWFKPSIE